MLKQKLVFLSMVAILAFILICPAAIAQADEKPSVNNWSLGLGKSFGGLGGRYVSIDESASAGYTAGIGLGGGSIGFVCRTGSNSGIELDGIFTFNFDLGDELLPGYGAQLMYGNFPSEKGEFVWQIGVSYVEPYSKHGADEVLYQWFPSIGIGWTL